MINHLEELLKLDEKTTIEIPSILCRHLKKKADEEEITVDEMAVKMLIEQVASNGNCYEETTPKRRKNLRQAIKAFAFDRETLATKSGVSVSTIINIETGKSTPRLETVRKIAKALGYNPDDLAL
jgi:DNA-binding XRE family transcriptional regulator